MANHNLGTIRGTIEIDYDGAGIVRAARDSDKAKGALGRLDGASTKVLSALGSFAKTATTVAGAVGTASQAVGLLSGAVAALGPVAAAGLAAAPGVILAYASAMTVARIATSGMSDALGAAEDGGKKFEKALEKLSPEAQKFAKAYQKIIPQLTAVRHEIQDKFFQGWAAVLGGVVSRVSTLSKDAAALAQTMGAVVRQVVNFNTAGSRLESVRKILQGTNAFLRQVGPYVAQLVGAFLNLAAQASAFGGTLGGSVAKALVTFTDFLNRIDLVSLFDKALPILQQFGEFFSNVGVIIAEIFGMFTTDGASAVGVLAELAAQLAAFLQSAQGQAALEALGQAMQAISGAAGEIFLALLQALAPAIVALAPGITVLANQIASVMVPAINALNPLLVALAGFLSDNMTWLGPLAGVVVAAAAGYKAYAAAAKAVAAVQAILKAQLVSSAAAWVASTAAAVANRVALVAGAVAMGVVRAATVAWTAVQWLLNAALSANPIALVVIAIAALVAGIIYAWKHSETFRNIVLAAWEAIKSATMALWNAIKVAFNAIVSAIGTALNWITSTTRTVWNGIVNLVKGYINAYRAVIVAVLNFIRNLWTTSLNNLRNIARAVWSAITSFIQGQINRIKSIIGGIKAIIQIVKNAFSQANSQARSMINSLISTVKGIPGRVTGALGNLGRLLYNKGRDLIRGFINGIGSMLGAVRDKAQSVVSAVTRFLPGSPAKEGPLSGQGYVLLRARRFMADFAQGINDGSQKPAAALLGSVGGLARATVPAVSGTSSGHSEAASLASAVGGTRTYQIAIGDKQFSELVVDAVTGAPVAVSKAADAGSRARSWAGSGGK